VDLRGAARLLGVHYQTAYQWVRDGTLPAMKVGNSYELDESDVRRLADQRGRPTPPPRQARVRSWSSLVERFAAHLLDGDEAAARVVVERLLAGGATPVELLDLLLAPALRRIGEEWATGEVTVAEEHRASAICERIVARLSISPRGRPRGVCVVATPEGEAHSLPASMAAVALRSDRWHVHHLGTEVPQPDLVRLAAGVGAGLAVLSVARREALEPGAATAAALAARGVPALVGRPGASLAELVERARSMARSPGAARRGPAQAVVEPDPSPRTA